MREKRMSVVRVMWLAGVVWGMGVLCVAGPAMGQSSATTPPNQGAGGGGTGEGTVGRAQLEAAQRRLTAARAAVRAKYEASDEFLQAQRELNEAQQAYDEARSPVLAKLRESDEYKRAQREAQLASDRVQQERKQETATTGNPTTSPAAATQPVSENLLDAVYKQLDERNEVSRMEADAIAHDDTSRRAKGRLDEVSARMNAIRAKYQAALLNDPDFVSAQRELEQARVNSAAAGSGGGATGGSRGTSGGGGAGGGSLTPGQFGPSR